MIHRIALCLIIAIGLSACGFHLRGSSGAQLSGNRKVQIAGIPPADPLYAALRNALTIAGANVVTDSAGGDAVVLQVSADETMRSISLNRTGLAREFDLGYAIKYEVKTARGETIEAPQKFKINREQYNDQFLVLGKAEEEQLIRQEMREEAAETLARRLVFLLTDKTAPAEAAARDEKN